MEQTIIRNDGTYAALDEWIDANAKGGLFVVHDDSLKFMEGLSKHLAGLEEKGLKLVYFRDFKPNPAYESVLKGVEILRKEGCGAMMAIGGGSAMDVAKCIKLYFRMEGDGAGGSFLKQQPEDPCLPFLAMPTTAGTGSEATRYAVIYYEGKKQSVTSNYIIPNAVLMDPDALRTLPLYQKKSTMLDALCHAVESFWSVNSTRESRQYSRQAIEQILRNMDGYFAGTKEGCAGMLLAANIAGKAINITQTTAGHAMCYKITSMFGASHGHAAALCDRVLFPWMVRNVEKCTDPRGAEYLGEVLSGIGQAFGCGSAEEGAERFVSLFNSLELAVPAATEEQIEVLTGSVNPDRLKNHPIALDKETIETLYRSILNKA